MFRYLITHGEYDDYQSIEVLHKDKIEPENFDGLIKIAINYIKEQGIELDEGNGLELIQNELIKNFNFIKPDKIQCYYDTGEYDNFE
jgi:hypothetical protein